MHIHEWETRLHHHNGLATYTDIWCAGCNTVMQWTEVASRLNATERLSAEDAMRILAMPIALGPRDDAYYKSLADKMRAYASALEGK